jgi:hypothetical protein
LFLFEVRQGERGRQVENVGERFEERPAAGGWPHGTGHVIPKNIYSMYFKVVRVWGLEDVVVRNNN